MVFMLEAEFGGRRAKCYLSFRTIREMNSLQVLKDCVASPFLIQAHLRSLAGVPPSNETDQRRHWSKQSIKGSAGLPTEAVLLAPEKYVIIESRCHDLCSAEAPGMKNGWEDGLRSSRMRLHRHKKRKDKKESWQEAEVFSQREAKSSLHGHQRLHINTVTLRQGVSTTCHLFENKILRRWEKKNNKTCVALITQTPSKIILFSGAVFWHFLSATYLLRFVIHAAAWQLLN